MTYIYTIIFWILTLLGWLQLQTIITHLHSEQAMNQENAENQSTQYCECNAPVDLWITICHSQIHVVTHHHPFLSYSFPFFKRHFLTSHWRTSFYLAEDTASQHTSLWLHRWALFLLIIQKPLWDTQERKFQRIIECQYSFFFWQCPFRSTFAGS